MTTQDEATLIQLSDAGQTVATPADDVRVRKVKDADGNSVGRVDDLLIDDQEHKVRFLRVEHGGFLGFGETKSFIPVDAITRITEDDVYIDHSRDHVAGAPRYDPDLVDDRPYYRDIYGCYGYLPYWGMGYAYRATPTTDCDCAGCAWVWQPGRGLGARQQHPPGSAMTVGRWHRVVGLIDRAGWAKMLFG